MENKNFKYNYILYNMENGYKWQTYAELHNRDFIRMCKGALPMNEPFLHKLHKLHWSAKINAKIKLPFKKLWFKKMTNGNFNDDKPVCFILFGGQYAIRDQRLCDYIRKLNPENKIAVHYRDLLKRESKHIEMLKGKVDVVYTYDKGEAEKYGIKYDGTYVYSRLAEISEPTEFEYDLFFVGYAKNRLSLIHNVLKRAYEEGIKCKFILVGVKESEKLNIPGVEYIDTPIPYTQVVDLVNRSKCILELTQQGAEGATMRTAEAIVYKRKLLTNCNRAEERPDFNPAQMKTFSNENDIDYDFIKEPIPYQKLSGSENFSPFGELLRLERFFETGEWN